MTFGAHVIERFLRATSPIYRFSLVFEEWKVSQRMPSIDSIPTDEDHAEMFAAPHSNPHPNQINVYPLGSRIVVQPEDAEARTQTGLVIPDTSQEKPQRGKVLAVGPGREIVDRDGNVTVVKSKIQPGHTVLYSRYAGSIIVVDNPDYEPTDDERASAPKLDLLVLSEADVLGIVLPPGQFDLGAGSEPAHE